MPFKCGFVAIVGWPNVGKSSLMNALLDTKLSIVSAKPQTTRESILGILNEPQIQMIFSDTPGWLKPNDDHQTLMKKSIIRSLYDDADVVVWVKESKPISEEETEFLEKLKKLGKPFCVAINKVDTLQDRHGEGPEGPRQSGLSDNDDVFYVSAKTKEGLGKLKKWIIKNLPEAEPYYPTDQITDRWERFYVSELIREKIFEDYSQEIPHASFVAVEEFKEREEGKDYIKVVVYVETEGQKRIIIGKKGHGIRHLSEGARHEIEKRLGRSIFLEIVVKVKKNWRKDVDFLNQNVK